MMQTDEIGTFLPKYLSEENYRDLLNELKSFPYNMDKRFYTTSLDKDILFQGDAYDSLPFVDFTNIENGCKMRYGLIISNTCDMDLSNKRLFPSSIMYAPILSFEKYIMFLRRKNIPEESIKKNISDIREQRFTSIFYLPAIYKVPESIVFLDRISNIKNDYIDRKTINEHRLFSLSDYGFYLLLFKLSVHFSRIRERVNRGHL